MHRNLFIGFRMCFISRNWTSNLVGICARQLHSFSRILLSIAGEYCTAVLLGENLTKYLTHVHCGYHLLSHSLSNGSETTDPLILNLSQSDPLALILSQSDPLALFLIHWHSSCHSLILCHSSYHSLIHWHSSCHSLIHWHSSYHSLTHWHSSCHSLTH